MMAIFDSVTSSANMILTANNTFDQSLMSEDLIRNLGLTLTYPLHGVTALTGAVTNLITMIVLSRLGLKSSMWVGGFALSLTDFIVTCVQIAVSCCYILNYAYPESDVDMAMLGVFALGYIRFAGFYISMWITTVISVERCFCVVFPFKVKRLFTRTRCVLVIVVIYCIYISLILPTYIFEKFDWVDVYYVGYNGNNIKKRILTVIHTVESYIVQIVVDIVGGIALSLTAQTILILCTLWMTYALKVSSEIRKRKTTNGDLHYSSKTSELSLGERKLLKVVMGLACVLTFCNIPRYAILAVYYIFPIISEDSNKNLNAFIWDISDFFGTLNTSSNFFVYLMLNNKFRNNFKQLFPLTCKMQLIKICFKLKY